MGKWYINKNKSEEKPIILFEFLVIIKRNRSYVKGLGSSWAGDEIVAGHIIRSTLIINLTFNLCTYYIMINHPNSQ